MTSRCNSQALQSAAEGLLRLDLQQAEQLADLLSQEASQLATGSADEILAIARSKSLMIAEAVAARQLVLSKLDPAVAEQIRDPATLSRIVEASGDVALQQMLASLRTVVEAAHRQHLLNGQLLQRQGARVQAGLEALGLQPSASAGLSVYSAQGGYGRAGRLG